MAATLSGINSALSIGLGIANLAIPGITALVKDIKAAVNSGGTVSYDVTFQIEESQLQKLMIAEQSDLDAINAELKRQGATPLTPTI